MAKLPEEQKGLSLRSERIGDWNGLAGRSVDPVGPTVVMLEIAPSYAVMSLSYDLSVDELLAWSRSLYRASESEWVAAGGVVGS